MLRASGDHKSGRIFCFVDWFKAQNAGPAALRTNRPQCDVVMKLLRAELCEADAALTPAQGDRP